MAVRGKLVGVVAMLVMVPIVGIPIEPSFATVQGVKSAAPQGITRTYSYESATGLVHYRLFTPGGYRAGQRLPLVVVLHGCGLSAQQEEGATAYDQVAQRNNFFVLYPDDDDQVHPLKCWQFYNPLLARGVGDLATVAGMTDRVAHSEGIDRKRVYAIGTSSGGLIVSDLAAAYPDVYAAVGLMAGGPYGPDLCMTGQAGLPGLGNASIAARGAYAAEGSKSRVMPFVVLNGDADNVVSPQCGAEAVQQWLRTNNLVLSGTETTPLRLTPSTVLNHAPTVAGGYSYTVSTFTEPNGAVIGLHYVVRGMGHGWSGGSSDPAYATTSNPLVAPSRPLGPNASVLSWSFFARFRLN